MRTPFDRAGSRGAAGAGDAAVGKCGVWRVRGEKRATVCGSESSPDAEVDQALGGCRCVVERVY